MLSVAGVLLKAKKKVINESCSPRLRYTKMHIEQIKCIEVMNSLRSKLHHVLLTYKIFTSNF